jgi:ribosomal protein S6--L-glutamate ligase
MSKLNFFVLATGSASKHLVKAIEDRGHSYDTHDPNNLYLFVSDSINGYDRIYNGSPKLEAPARILAKNYDAVISRLGGGLEHGASILRHLTENLSIYCAQTPDGLETASNKLKTTQKLSSKGLKVPVTTYAKNPIHIEFLIKKIGGLPAVGKMIRGSQGNGVFILETPQAANTSLQSFYNLNASMKLQKFIESGATDIRAIVVGDKVAVAMERSGKKDFRANISQGGSGKKIELSAEDVEICVRAAKAVDLEFAGVDIIKDKDGKTYIIEINGNPGTKIIDITGHNYFLDLVKHVEEKVGKREKQQDNKEASVVPADGPAAFIARLKANLVGAADQSQQPTATATESSVDELRKKYPKMMEGL